MRLSVIAGACALALVAGCNQQDPNLAKETSENPFFAQAEAQLQANNYVEAVNSYEAALQANPEVAQAHFEIARIYSERLNDPVSAIYHFDRYVELRPESDQRASVEQLRDDAKLTFAANNAKDSVELQQTITRLQNENKLLKDELEGFKQRLAAATSPPAGPAFEAVASVSETAVAEEVSSDESGQPSILAAVAEEATAETSEDGEADSKPAQPARTYVLQSGDSLWKIARKFYPDDRDINAVIKRIREANPETLANDRNLKIGTEIVLP
ncbi:MAG: tetratricopeptide repeat protein [Verrucomicrobiota bacterium]